MGCQIQILRKKICIIQTQKESQQSKKNTKPKALEVTNNSMDKHILRMQKLSSAKSKSFEKKSVSSKPKKNHNNLKKQKLPSHSQRSSVPNVMNPQYQSTQNNLDDEDSM